MFQAVSMSCWVAETSFSIVKMWTSYESEFLIKIFTISYWILSEMFFRWLNILFDSFFFVLWKGIRVISGMYLYLTKPFSFSLSKKKNLSKHKRRWQSMLCTTTCLDMVYLYICHIYFIYPSYSIKYLAVFMLQNY